MFRLKAVDKLGFDLFVQSELAPGSQRVFAGRYSSYAAAKTAASSIFALQLNWNDTTMTCSCIVNGNNPPTWNTDSNEWENETGTWLEG